MSKCIGYQGQNRLVWYRGKEYYLNRTTYGGITVYYLSERPLPDMDKVGWKADVSYRFSSDTLELQEMVDVVNYRELKLKQILEENI
jgi:hypothetical protein